MSSLSNTISKISILVKKLSIISTAHNMRDLWMCPQRMYAILSNTPQSRRAAITLISAKRMNRVSQSMYEMYARDGGTKNELMTAHIAAMQKTISRRINAMMLFMMQR